MNCPACHSPSSRIAVKSPCDVEYFSIRSCDASFMQCLQCGSLYQTPWPSPEELDVLYPEDYQNYTRKDVALLSKLVDLQNNAVARAFVTSFGKNVSVLDFGCGDGRFLTSLHGQGVRDLTGFEPHRRSDGVYRDAGYKLATDINALINDTTRFDIIRMNHVIEHLSDLDDTMVTLGRLLKPGGRILVQTPNPDTLTWRAFKRFWGPLHFPYHTVIFTPRGMKLSAPRWGLKVSSIQGCTMPTGWSMSLENIVKSVLSLKRRGRTPVYGFLAIGGVAIAILEKAVVPQRTAIIDYILTAGE